MTASKHTATTSHEVGLSVDESHFHDQCVALQAACTEKHVRINARLDKIEHAIFGNGQQGLVKDVTSTKTIVDKLDTDLQKIDADLASMAGTVDKMRLALYVIAGGVLVEAMKVTGIFEVVKHLIAP